MFFIFFTRRNVRIIDKCSTRERRGLLYNIIIIIFEMFFFLFTRPRTPIDGTYTYM